MSSSPGDQEIDTLTTRGTAFVLLVLTVLFSLCWLGTQAPQFQIAAYLGGLLSIMTWLSYCQQKTSDEMSHLRARE